jgi:hypothetical protein
MTWVFVLVLIVLAVCVVAELEMGLRAPLTWRLSGRFRAGVALTLASAGLSCNSNPSAPSIAQLGGRWTATLIVNSVDGGECLAGLVAVGMSSTYGLTIDQNGSALEAYPSSGCTLRGTASSSSFTLTAEPSLTCNTFRGLRCPDGSLRDIALVQQTISGHLDATITITDRQQYNLFAAGTSMLAGTLTTTATGTMARCFVNC